MHHLNILNSQTALEAGPVSETHLHLQLEKRFRRCEAILYDIVRDVYYCHQIFMLSFICLIFSWASKNLKGMTKKTRASRGDLKLIRVEKRNDVVWLVWTLLPFTIS